MTIGGSPLQACAQNGGSLKPGKEEREQRSVTPAAKTMICGDYAEAHATGDSQTGRPLF